MKNHKTGTNPQHFPTYVTRPTEKLPGKDLRKPIKLNIFQEKFENPERSRVIKLANSKSKI